MVPNIEPKSPALLSCIGEHGLAILTDYSRGYCRGGRGASPVAGSPDHGRDSGNAVVTPRRGSVVKLGM